MADTESFEASAALLRTGSTVPTEPPARPKVLRRPPQFSRNGAPVQLNDTLIETKQAAEPIKPQALATHSAWQEDSRFGLVMIAIVLLVNIALGFAVPHMNRADMANDGPTVTMLSGSSMPAPTSNRRNNVTLYSDPAMLDESAQAMDLNNLSADHNDFSVDSPAPTARAIDQ